MLNYLEKFNNLPVELRDKISGKKVMDAISEIEKKYNITLATTVMRIMVKDIPILDLAKYFVFEYNLDARTAEKLVDELKEKVFADLADYLGFEKDEEVISLEDLEKEADLEQKTPGVSSKKQEEDWMDFKNKEIKARGSGFFFSPEDEEEVQELTKKLEEFKVDKKAKIDSKEELERKIDKQVAEVRKKLNIHFSSEDLSGRFNQILKTYLRGVRNKIDTKQTLIKKIENGGLDFGEVFVDNILLLADSVKSKSPDNQSDKPENSSEALLKKISKKEEQSKEDKSGKEKLDAIINASARDAEYSFDNMSEKAKKEQEKIKKQKEQSNLDNKTKQEFVSEKPAEDKKVKISPNIEKTQANTVSRLVPGDKKKIVDVKAPKLLGPIDELKEMTLQDFRRLGETPLKIIQKIEEKFSFLEEDSYAKRLEGISAWRQSPVNKLYLKIGRKSIMKKQAINVIIKQMADNHEEVLTEDEFDAILSLNKRIRF